MKQAALYQIKGPFKAGQNVIANLGENKVRIGISIDTKDWLPLSKDEGFSFTLSGLNGSTTIQLGRTCMYQTDQGVSINSIVFNEDAPQSTIINIVGC